MAWAVRLQEEFITANVEGRFLRKSVDFKKSMERVTGIEPAWPAWKAGALPLSYTRRVGRR
jgi:hypothetical protein